MAEAWWAVLALLVWGVHGASWAPGQLAVVGYVPEYRYGAMDWAGASKYVTHMVLFSLEVAPDGSITALDRFPDESTAAAARQATRAEGAKLLVCFGGNSRTNGFPAVATSAELRRVFARNVLEFLVAHELDGVDLNWEYPRTRAEWAGLWLLIDELHALLAPRGLVLTMAVYPSQEPLLPPTALAKLELVLDMAYDNVCARGERPPCKHSTLAFAERVVDDAERAGFPLAKLALGVPFYARDVYTGAAVTYAALVEQHGVDKNPRSDRTGNWYYNGPATLAKKVHLAHQRGLGGIMIWELGQDVKPDAKGSLLRALGEEVAKVNSNTKKDEL